MISKNFTLNQIINCHAALLNLKNFNFDSDTVWNIGVNISALSIPMNEWYLMRRLKVQELSPSNNNVSDEKSKIQFLFADWLKEVGEKVIEVNGIVPLKRSKLLDNNNQIPGLELSYLMCIIDLE
jgi:hypothetical protein